MFGNLNINNFISQFNLDNLQEQENSGDESAKYREGETTCIEEESYTNFSKQPEVQAVQSEPNLENDGWEWGVEWEEEEKPKKTAGKVVSNPESGPKEHFEEVLASKDGMKATPVPPPEKSQIPLRYQSLLQGQKSDGKMLKPQCNDDPTQLDQQQQQQQKSANDCLAPILETTQETLATAVVKEGLTNTSQDRILDASFPGERLELGHYLNLSTDSSRRTSQSSAQSAVSNKTPVDGATITQESDTTAEPSASVTENESNTPPSTYEAPCPQIQENITSVTSENISKTESNRSPHMGTTPHNQENGTADIHENITEVESKKSPAVDGPSQKQEHDSTESVTETVSIKPQAADGGPKNQESNTIETSENLRSLPEGKGNYPGETSSILIEKSSIERRQRLENEVSRQRSQILELESILRSAHGEHVRVKELQEDTSAQVHKLSAERMELLELLKEARLETSQIELSVHQEKKHSQNLKEELEATKAQLQQTTRALKDHEQLLDDGLCVKEEETKQLNRLLEEERQKTTELAQKLDTFGAKYMEMKVQLKEMKQKSKEDSESRKSAEVMAKADSDKASQLQMKVVELHSRNQLLLAESQALRDQLNLSQQQTASTQSIEDKSFSKQSEEELIKSIAEYKSRATEALKVANQKAALAGKKEAEATQKSHKLAIELETVISELKETTEAKELAILQEKETRSKLEEFQKECCLQKCTIEEVSKQRDELKNICRSLRDQNQELEDKLSENESAKIQDCEPCTLECNGKIEVEEATESSEPTTQLTQSESNANPKNSSVRLSNQEDSEDNEAASQLFYVKQLQAQRGKDQQKMRDLIKKIDELQLEVDDHTAVEDDLRLQLSILEGKAKRAEELEKEINMEYLKNCIVSYLCSSSPSEKKSLFPVISTILRMNKQEIDLISRNIDSMRPTVKQVSSDSFYKIRGLFSS